MPYVRRALEAKLTELTARFGGVLVTGPRQAGKTSLLSHVSAELFGGQATSIAFDTPSEVAAFRRDPDLFFLNHPGILFLDEVQHVPDIFPYLKRELDRAVGAFRFLLSGSQHFELMKGVTESLAGRVAVLDLWPFAVQEVRGKAVRPTVELLEGPARGRAGARAALTGTLSAPYIGPAVLQRAAGESGNV